MSHLVDGLPGASPWLVPLPFLVLSAAGASPLVGLVFSGAAAVLLGVLAHGQRLPLWAVIAAVAAGAVVAVVAAVGYRAARRSGRVRGRIRRRPGPLFRLGRPPAAALATLVTAGWLFGGVTWDVVAREGLAADDARLLHGVTARRGPGLTSWARVVTGLGSGPVVYGLLVVVGVLWWRRTSRWTPPVAAVAVLAAGQLVRLMVNRLVARPRPPAALWLAHPHGYAYPSGHTATATIGYGLAAALIISLLPAGKAMLAAPVAAAVLITTGVGVSRVYLGVHWPTDVVGGWAFGAAWLALAASAVALDRRRRNRRQPTRPRPARAP
ncbi:phosphatase PAP2 family protein [Frankia sp. CiP1_Cm_nod1]|uniref:phosphatase PAP2 family protein n=1 Tax=Frankia sp. CiP1_Cm_nod1 TaxID=2897160 RepID=UPI0020254C6E